MKDISNTDHDKHEEDAEEDAISLSDFPITAGNQNDHNSSTTYHHHQDRQSNDLFEFFNYDLNKDISHADDIFLRGKLIPFQQQHHRRHHHHHQTTSSFKHQRSESHRMTFREEDAGGEQRNFHHHRRWESCSDLTSSSPPWNTSPKAGQVRNSSRSLDLRRDSSVKSVAADQYSSSSRVWKPRWYVLMFGSFRFRPEMELRDIKNRQVRRAPAATMFQPLDDGGEGKKKKPGVSLTSVGRKSSWSLLKALICKGNIVADDVTASVGCVPKA